ncbi:putative mitochondrial protein AtMg00310 [Silene latifolia]|uniref:putative mitochondrial protein AtMg00310 n=1 Tax=Silene latifolia TaxID=37657 RepID=UPI003D785C75
MTIFKLPANFFEELRSLVTRFWWGSNQGQKKRAWISWDRMCRPKTKGGLGFRDFNKFNEPLLGKQAWRLLTNDDTLMVCVLKGKYFPHCDFMEAEIGTNPSYIWRSIFGVKTVLDMGIRKRVGDGLNTNVWTDPWILGTSSRKAICPRGDSSPLLKVAEHMNEEGSGWNYDIVHELFLPFESIWEGLGLDILDSVGFERVREWVEVMMEDADGDLWIKLMVGS